MFNIWKQAWRNEDTSCIEPEASSHQEPQSGTAGDQLCAGSASVPLTVPPVSETASSRPELVSKISGFSVSRKHARNIQQPEDDTEVEERPTKKPRKANVAKVPGHDSLANYLPEVLVERLERPHVDAPKKSPVISQSYVDEVVERGKRVNSKAVPITCLNH